LSRSGTDRQPWNKGKLIGAKPPLRLKHIWAIRSRLQLAGRKRDLALFNLAIDSKLRGRDLVSLRLGDIGLDPAIYGTHSLRRTKATMIDKRSTVPPKR